MGRSDRPDVSRLSDGRLIYLLEDGHLFVHERGSWVRARDVTIGAALDSQPLDKFEIAGLVGAGIFHTEEP